MADGDEEAGGIELGLLAGDGVLEAQAAHLGVPADVGDRAVPPELDLRVVPGAVLHDLGGPELVAAVDDGDLGAEPGQEDRLLHGGVAAADDGDVVVPEEEAVAGGARRDAVAEQALLVGDAEHEGAGAGGDDERVGERRGLVGVGVADPDVERPR